MSARPFDPMEFDIDAFEQSLPGAFNVPPLPDSDEDMSEVSEAASRSVNFTGYAGAEGTPDPNVESSNSPFDAPMADVENIQLAEAIPEANYRNLSTTQIKKLVPFGPILHLLDPDQQKILLEENETNTLDGRPALVSAVTKRFSIPGDRRRFTITSTGKKVFW